MKKTDARRAALKTLSAVRRTSGFSDETLNTNLSALGAADKALCSRLVYGALQNINLLDYFISGYLSGNIKRLEPKLLDLLRISSYQILFLDRVPDSAAINEAVNISKEINKKASGLVNAVLRRISENKNSLSAYSIPDEANFLSVRYSHPLWLCEYLLRKYGSIFTKDFLEANNEEPPVYLQVNTRLISAEDLLRKLFDLGVDAELNPDLKSIKLDKIGELLESDLFSDGYFFVQDKAARAAVDIASPAAGDSVLDLCAAPGGKSFASALNMENSGRILSCDISPRRLERLREASERLKFSIIKTKVMDATEAELAGERFDVVIADVPCSGFGVIRKKPEIRYKKLENIAELPRIQKNILNAAGKLIKDGGKLVYSTCTIFEEENEKVVADFLDKNKNFYIAEEKRFWPHIDDSDGFYICLLKKKT